MRAIAIALAGAMAAGAGGRPSVIDAIHKGHAVAPEKDGVEAVRAALANGGDVNERDIKFQNDHKLQATGELDAPTRKALGIR